MSEKSNVLQYFLPLAKVLTLCVYSSMGGTVEGGRVLGVYGCHVQRPEFRVQGVSFHNADCLILPELAFSFPFLGMM